VLGILFNENRNSLVLQYVGVLGPAGPQPTSESVLHAPNPGW